MENSETTIQSSNVSSETVVEKSSMQSSTVLKQALHNSEKSVQMHVEVTDRSEADPLLNKLPLKCLENQFDMIQLEEDNAADAEIKPISSVASSTSSVSAVSSVMKKSSTVVASSKLVSSEVSSARTEKKEMASTVSSSLSSSSFASSKSSEKINQNGSSDTAEVTVVLKKASKPIAEEASVDDSKGADDTVVASSDASSQKSGEDEPVAKEDTNDDKGTKEEANDDIVSTERETAEEAAIVEEKDSEGESTGITDTSNKTEPESTEVIRDESPEITTATFDKTNIDDKPIPSEVAPEIDPAANKQETTASSTEKTDSVEKTVSKDNDNDDDDEEENEEDVEEEETEEEEAEEPEDGDEKTKVTDSDDKTEPEPSSDKVDVSDETTQKPALNERDQKQDNLNTTLKEIISDIDSNIKEQENIALLKQQEQELLRKQQELALEIREQQLLAEKLAIQNRFQQEQLLKQAQSYQAPQQFQQSAPKYLAPAHEENGIFSSSRPFEPEESSNISKKIDLNKIFTPATDGEEILPKTRKLYSSSAFYSPTLHPTVEDQVELARRISYSLSDENNQKSKGQSMYVNRKKRSEKWVHEGCAKGSIEATSGRPESEDESKENNDLNRNTISKNPLQNKVPLKLLMNPRGQIRDYNTDRESLNIDTGLLSPDKCAELLTALETQKGRGAELFAKRRKKAENWVVGESNTDTQSPSDLADNYQYQPRLSTSPNVLAAYSDAGKHRVQLNMHQEQLLEKYAKPGLKVIKTPWEAALETGSASAAFVEEQPGAPYYSPVSAIQPESARLSAPSVQAPQYYDNSHSASPYKVGSAPSSSFVVPTDSSPVYSSFNNNKSQYYQPQGQSLETQRSSVANYQRDLAYKPSVPQGWRAPSVSLPRECQKQCVEWNLGELEERQECRVEAATPCEFLNGKEDEIMTHTTFLDTLNSQSPELVANNEMYINDIKMGECKESLQQQRKEQLYRVSPNYKNIEHQQSLLNSHQIDLLGIEDDGLKKKIVIGNTEKVEPFDNPSFENEARQISREVGINTEEEEYVRVAVCDLISTFEQQNKADNENIKERKKEEQEKLQSMGNVHQVFIKNDSTLLNRPDDVSILAKEISKELYIPKDIPLESYAPPPVISEGNNTPRVLGTADTRAKSPFLQSFVASETNDGFPQKKYSGSNAFPLATSTPPKQQHWAPNSYQKVPQNTSQAVPQVSFNPSPLPYDKLAKFENPSPDQGSNNYYSYSPQRHIGASGPKIRNLSPAPYAVSPSAYTASPSSRSYLSPRPPSQQFNTQGYENVSSPSSVRFNSNSLLQSQNFNSSARGWKPTAPTSFPNLKYTQQKPVAVSTHDLPYTDF